MRILQVIDSLEAGGAEMMAVNYANALSSKLDFSGIVATRREGSLKAHLNPNMPYLFLNRKRTFDFKAVWKLKKFCESHQVEFLHAHSSSYAIACMVKMIHPRIKIIWHDHDGMSEFLDQRKAGMLRIASIFFSGIITVNELLKTWDAAHLYCKNVIYLPNFFRPQEPTGKFTILKGIEGKRILCLANLRPQKNHQMLIEVALLLRSQLPEWSFHLVGKDFEDHYSDAIKRMVATHNLSEQVYLYGSIHDVSHVIGQSEICILTSSSEGLPVSLLEYGFAKKAVVVTNVGEIKAIVVNDYSGFIIKPDDVAGFVEAIKALAGNQALRLKFGENLHATVQEKHSDDTVIQSYIDWLKNICNE
ncbi:glycosyltransferase family 4 protein [Flavobacterium pallidum]|uniref:Glycosyltransferase n=1 Tax=Flavobacterium pallidum TaxID=2172098 RepID=A0A2S1SH56_9FLAO|nr:glycosyltransferase family 4 protein [Flavobacterium pallidum]AWI25682.1 glycosyltransferase [Flavobacterium pallidum]